MKKNTIRLSFLCLLLTISFTGISLKLSAQSGKEYLVEINPDSGTFTNKFYLPGVDWVSMWPTGMVINPVKKLLYFHGADKWVNGYNYSINLDSGTLRQYPLPGNATIFSYKYDNASNKILALLQSGIANFSFEDSTLSNIQGSFNIYDGVLETADSNHYILFASGYNRIYTGNLSDGSFIMHKDYSFPYSFVPLAYDKNLGGIFLAENFPNGIGYKIIKVDLSSLDTVSHFSVPNLKGISYQAYDYKNHKVYLYGATKKFQQGLLTLNMVTGKVEAEVEFPYRLNSHYNVIGLITDTSTGKLYGLHWDDGVFSSVNENTFKNSKGMTIYPNPASSTLNIQSDDPVLQKVSLLDLTGKEVLLQGCDIVPKKEMQIDVSSLPAGLYLARIFTDKGMETNKVSIAK